MAVAVLLTAPLLRLLICWLAPQYRFTINSMFFTEADALGAGCFLALTRNELWKQSWYRGFLQSPWFVLLPLTVLQANRMFIYPTLYYGLLLSVMDVGIAVGIDWCVRNPEGLVGRVLQWRPLAFLGVLSYSLYLWQQPFLNYHSARVAAWMPLNILGALAAATLSYYVIERPFLALKERYFEV